MYLECFVFIKEKIFDFNYFILGEVLNDFGVVFVFWWSMKGLDGFRKGVVYFLVNLGREIYFCGNNF